MKKIAMILDGSYPSDIRVKKEAESLAEHFDVTVFVPFLAGQLRKEVVNDVKIIRFGPPYTFSKRGMYDVVTSVVGYHPHFKKFVFPLLENGEFDALHIHDLPLARTFSSLRDRFRLVLDLHENYPEAVKTWFKWRKSLIIKWKNRLFFKPEKFFKIEREMCLEYDHILAVVDEMKDRIIENHGISEAKITVVSNTERKDFDLVNEKPKFHSMFDEFFTITYVGGIGPHRGLDTAIRAMPKIVETKSDARLLIIGSGSADTESYLKSIVSSLKLDNYIHFLGRVPFQQVNYAMSHSSVNIIPHLSDGHTDNTIPHKLFQCMMAGKPLLVSSCKPLKRIVLQTNAGYVFEADDPKDFALKVLEIANAASDEIELKIKNAKHAVLEKGYNWETDAERLMGFYRDLLNT